ncbi:MAG: AbrB/MazE/SpoVT family DNA-binding domain-containing protein [Thaumarchaeota archaeon]|nr:AbrB/MazE/SpoVT family DNA-binding domain-containing protein [Nitrososphaerota archaeon]
MQSNPTRSKITQKGRVVIPKTIREKIGLKEGEYVRIELREGEIIVIKEPSSATDTMKGLLSDTWPRKETSITIQRKLRKEWQARENR